MTIITFLLLVFYYVLRFYYYYFYYLLLNYYLYHFFNVDENTIHHIINFSYLFTFNMFLFGTSGYLPPLDEIKDCGAVVNINNDAEKCFLRFILPLRHSARDNLSRLTKYINYENTVDVRVNQMSCEDSVDK